jgi:hypothetical protein
LIKIIMASTEYSMIARISVLSGGFLLFFLFLLPSVPSVSTQKSWKYKVNDCYKNMMVIRINWFPVSAWTWIIGKCFTNDIQWNMLRFFKQMIRHINLKQSSRAIFFISNVYALDSQLLKLPLLILDSLIVIEHMFTPIICKRELCWQ